MDTWIPLKRRSEGQSSIVNLVPQVHSTLIKVLGGSVVSGNIVSQRSAPQTLWRACGECRAHLAAEPRVARERSAQAVAELELNAGVPEAYRRLRERAARHGAPRALQPRVRVDGETRRLEHKFEHLGCF